MMKFIFTIGLVLCITTQAQASIILAGCTQPETGILEPLQSFFKNIHPEDTKSDPMGVSILITYALNIKKSLHLKVKDVADSMEKPEKEGRRSFLEIKNTIQKFGYKALGFRADGPMVHVDYNDVAFLVDRKIPEDPAIVLLFASTDKNRYLLYTNGYVCPMPIHKFEQYFSNETILFVEENPDVEVRSTPILTLQDFGQKPPSQQKRSTKELKLEDFGLK